MNAGSEKPRDTLAEQLAAFDSRLQSTANDVDMLADIQDGIGALLSSSGSSEAEIRKMLQERYEEGALRKETFQLVKSMLDRFMSKILVDFPTHEQEMQIVALHDSGFDPSDLDSSGLEPVMGVDDILAFRGLIMKARVEEKVRRYITDIVQATRKHPQVAVGASPRAAVFMLRMAKAMALLEGRTYCVPDDVKRFTTPILRHRLILKPEAEIEGLSTDDMIADVLSTVTVPM